MKRFRYRQLVLLVGLILPIVAMAWLGWRNFEQENKNTQDKAKAAVVQALLSKLESIKVGELGASSTRTGKHSHPAVMLVASVSHSDGVLVLDSPPDLSRSALIREKGRLADIQRNFSTLSLNEEAWKPYGDKGLWLSMTPPPRGSTQRLVIAVRGEEIVKQVRDERKQSGNDIDFQIGREDSLDPALKAQSSWSFLWPPLYTGEAEVLPVKRTGQKLDNRFPGLVISFPLGGQGGASEESQQFYAVSLLLVVSVTLLGWYLVLRDTLSESRIAAMRSQFVSSVSHELKTPLTAIRMYAETLQMRGSTDPQIQREFLNTIVNESERLTRLLNNVLDLSRIERGQRNYHFQPTTLGDVVRSAARTMHFPLSEQGFELSVEIHDELPSVRIDRDALEQAILNLLSNAMKYSGDSRMIALTLRSKDGSALIQVVDHGIGIALEERKRIFETFYRVASPENRAISGTGLGLALIAHTAEGHGGTVDVASMPGEGSTFSIRIPLNGNGHS